MANESFWYQLGVAIRRLLLGGKSGGQRTGQQGQSGQRGGSASRTGNSRSAGGAQPTLKPSAPKGPAQQQAKPAQPTAPSQQSSQFESSPGQFGAGATRDLVPSELRGAKLEYAPNMDGDPDPGEIVWTWVPYVENDGRGKDRPVLILGRIDADTVFGCYVSTKHHRDFISIGAGAWDAQGRESFVSPERILRVTHDGMRREGSVVPREKFEAAARGIVAYHGLV